MSSGHILILAGNPNMAATTNAILRATQQLRVDTEKSSSIFEETHIFHSEQSFQALAASTLPWKNALHRHGLSPTTIIHHVIALEEPTAERFAELIGQLKTIVNPLQNTQYYVDLTNGVSALKAILSVFAYVLDIQNVYTMEVVFAREAEDRKRQTTLFLDELNVEPGVTISYHQFPPINDFDSFGKCNYTEVLRYQRIYEEFCLSASRHCEVIDRDYLKSLLLDGANSRLIGDVTGDPAHYRHAVFSFAAAVEELAKAWLTMLDADTNYDGLTLGQKLAKIRQRLHSNALYFVDEKTLEHLTVLLNTLRNEVVHSKSGRSTEFTKLQADLIRQLTQAFGAFVLGALTSFVDHRGQIVQPKRLDVTKLDPTVSYYFGLDGDGTGEFIEGAFHNSGDTVAEVRRRSRLISKAIGQIADLVCKRSRNRQAVLFAEGDNLLFLVPYSEALLEAIQQSYKETTGQRCSIGYGLTPYEASIALKLAKAEDLGVVGVELGQHGDSPTKAMNTDA